MEKRTFLRTMLDIFFNNAFFKALSRLWRHHYCLSPYNSYYNKNIFITSINPADVKICKEDISFYDKNLKFLKNVPLNKLERTERFNNKILLNKGE